MTSTAHYRGTIDLAVFYRREKISVLVRVRAIKALVF